MKFINFIEEKIFYILFQLLSTFIIIFILFMVEVPGYYLLLLIIFSLLILISYLDINFIFCNKKYKKIVELVDNLDEKYLISEIIPESNNLVNKAYIYALKRACKAMNDKISLLEKENNDYHEYIESFVHEIKTPISALSLTFDNNKDKISKKEIDKIDMYIDQMLYYARSETTEKDYFVRKLNIKEVIHNVVLKYKPYLLDEKIVVKTDNLDKTIYTDEKWLLFVLSQIIQNSIKYKDKSKKESIINIEAKNNENNVELIIFDNGIGIKESDLPRVFEKGFTGSDRSKTKSTGMGLYLAKKICDKLGLSIKVSSIYEKKTKVVIIFPKSNFNKLD